MPSSVFTHARSTAAQATTASIHPPTWEQLRSVPSLQSEAFLLEQISRVRFAALLRSGSWPGSIEDVREAVLQESIAAAVNASAMSGEARLAPAADVQRQSWQRNYRLAHQAVLSPVRLALHGTDFMPVRCLVVPRTAGRNEWRDVQVVAQFVPRQARDGASVDELQVVTASSVRRLKSLAAELGLHVSHRLYWPVSSFNRRKGRSKRQSGGIAVECGAGSICDSKEGGRS